MKKDSKISFGKMMSSPALKYNDKVFAFFYNGNMTIKLGEKFNPKDFGISKFELLNPFKTKGPLKGWFVIDKSQNNKWESLSSEALNEIKKHLK